MIGSSCLQRSQVRWPVWKVENWYDVPVNKKIAYPSQPSSLRLLDIMKEAAEVSVTPHEAVWAAASWPRAQPM